MQEVGSQAAKGSELDPASRELVPDLPGLPTI